MRPSTALAAFATGAFLYDVVWRPTVVAAEARKEAKKRGKPLLNVTTGARGSDIRGRILGPPLWGDVNENIEGTEVGESGHAAFGRPARLKYADNTFGATIASHVLTHTHDPKGALRELHRVTDGPVFVITPPWWAPHTWAHLGRRWFLSPDGKWMKLWETPRGSTIDSSTSGLNNALAVSAALRLLSPY